MVNPLEDLITKDDIADIAAKEGLILDDEERISVLETMRSIDVQACPGSGKTTLIATKLILLAKKWPLQQQGICVLSHTNVAKNEIIDRLKRSKTKTAQRLLSYPHFIGTIQEFVGKFAAFPLIRSDGTKISLVDTDVCVDLIYSRLQHGTRSYVDQKSRYSNVLYDFDLKFSENEMSINVPTFPIGSDSPSYKDLYSVRCTLLEEGYFFYRDIFAIACEALSQNKTLISALQQRFPCVFLDEMQDTQKFQDEILCDIFPIDNPELMVQRFGDPDQAIFQGIGSEEPNESYNGKSAEDMDIIVHRSHRFDNGIASKIKPFSFNEIPLETELSNDAVVARSESHVEGGSFEHTIIIFDDDTCASVVQTFGDIISNQFSDESKLSQRFSAKAVGAVGNEIDPNTDQLKIGHYWPRYDKSKSISNFKEGTLIEVVRFCRQSPSVDWADKYKMLINCIVRLLRMSNARDNDGKYFLTTSMREWLKAKGKWIVFRKLIYIMLDTNRDISRQFWENVYKALWKICEIQNTSVAATEYMAFAEVDVHTDEPEANLGEGSDPINPSTRNIFVHQDGFQIELSTIHGIKGETHDATLVVETKNYCFDLGVMLQHITKELPTEESPNSALSENARNRRANKQFLRQCYVAMSRPKHLLCLAMHTDRVTADQIQLLQNNGWNVQSVSKPIEGGEPLSDSDS